MIREQYGCTPGLIVVLHTWGQRLNHHFHIHIVMTAGGLSTDKNRWIAIDQDEMETRAAEIAGCFKQRFLKGLRRLLNQEQLRFPLAQPDRPSIDSMLSIVEQKDWIADVGATPKKYRDQGQRRMSLGYVGKYVAGTAIGDGRIISDEGGIVIFRAFDYRTGEHIEIKMPGPHFVEAFLRHVLPARLHRCRTAGIFAPQGRTARLDRCRALLGEPTARATGRKRTMNRTRWAVMPMTKRNKDLTCPVRSAVNRHVSVSRSKRGSSVSCCTSPRRSLPCCEPARNCRSQRRSSSLPAPSVSSDRCCVR